MILTYKIALLSIIFISFIFAIDGRAENKNLAERAAALCIVSIISFIVSSIVL